MRGIFEFFSMFDVITPAIGLIQDFKNDPTLLQTNSWTFFINYEQSLDSGYNAKDVEKLLSKNGIHHWGTQITNGELFLCVHKSDARWAEQVLCRSGVPVHERSLGTQHSNKTN